MDMKELLKKISLFENLRDQDVDVISQYCRQKDFQTGDVLFYEGEEADKLYIILEGEVEVWADFKQKDRDLLAVATSGDIVGEMALLDDLPRSATLIARTRTKAYYIDNVDFNDLLQKCPSVALLIVKSISAIVRKSNQNFVATLRKRNQDLENTYEELIETQRRLNREEKLSTLGKFSSMILHDIKNPVSVIKSYADLALMRHGKDLGDAEKYFHHIQKEAKRLNSLANELLDFSRGEVSLNLSLIKPFQLIDEVLEEIAPIVSARNLVIHKKISTDQGLLLDRERILRVLHNILDNARKALPVKGEIWISSWEEDRVIALAIKDNGIGMSPEILKHVFEPFFTKSERGGTGLGMMIARNIVEAHNGSIDIQSEQGKGTTVTLRFPITAGLSLN